MSPVSVRSPVCFRPSLISTLFPQPEEKGEHPVGSQHHASCLYGVPRQRCDSTRPTCSTCTRSRIQADCIYEDAPLDSPPPDSIGPAKNQDEALDASSEASGLSHTGKPCLPAAGDATFPPLPSPTSLKNFRPLLLTDYEDPLLYALSDISLEDMNMSLWVPFFNYGSRSKPSPAVFCFSLTGYNLAFTFPGLNNKPSSLGIPQELLFTPFSYTLPSYQGVTSTKNAGENSFSCTSRPCIWTWYGTRSKI